MLIADDHKLIRETWSFILNSDPRFSVIAQCSNGEEAIEMAQKLRPKIALLDMNMAPMNGIEATEQIRKFSPSTKIIGVSMHSQPAYVKKLLKLGAMGYVTKNSPRKEMLDAIHAVNSGSMYICQEVKNILSEQMMNEEENGDGLNQLSEREIEVINLIREGMSSKEIADKLGA